MLAVTLASHTANSQSASELSMHTNIAHPTVSKLLKLLNDAGLVNSVRGVQGGYSLARAIDQITLADLIDAIEGGTQLTECSMEQCDCTYLANCGLKHNWSVVSSSIDALLRSVTLEDMTGSLSVPGVVRRLSQTLSQHERVEEKV